MRRNGKPVIPAKGLVGQRMIEAATGDIQAICELIRNELMRQTGREWADITAIYLDHVVVQRDGRLYARPYTLNEDNQVQLGQEYEVIKEFTPVRPGETGTRTTEASAARAAGAAFIEAVGEETGGRWLIRVIEAGQSTNRNYYPDATLREAVPLLEGARVFVKSDEEHIATRGKSIHNLIGALQHPRFVEGAAPDTGSIEAELQLIDPGSDIAVKVREAWNKGLHNLFGFSIDADADVKNTRRNGVRLREATRITRINSVDLIIEPGAGGRLIRIVEAANPKNEEQDDMSGTLRARMVEAVLAHNPAFDVDGAGDEALIAAYSKTIAAPVAQDTGVKEVRLVEARMIARERISASTLPDPAKERLVTRFVEAAEPFTPEEVDKAIEGERTYLSRFTESGKPLIPFEGQAQVEDRSLKMGEMLDAFFDPAHKDHRSAQSFKECYIEMTGDRRVTGRVENCDMARLRESVGARFVEAAMTSATFSHVLGDSITRRLLADYRFQNNFDAWRPVTNIVPISDFRTQERTRWGGFGDLPVVPEGTDYQDGDTPTDEVATYKAAKTGRLSTVTLEMIRNDDVGAIRQIPIKLSRVAKRTLSKFVLNFLRNNGPIYDGKALFHADHKNLSTAALSGASWAAARLAMMAQVEKDSGERLGIPPRYLLVSADQEEAAYDLFKQRGNNNDQSFIQTTAPQVIPVWYWTDPNDWVAVADPLDTPTIEIGFLDGNQEPEIFVQDNPSVGSLFANDTITYKIRHVYGGAVMDYRGLHKAVVA